MHSIYLDFNSTAPLLAEAAHAMAAAEAAHYANPASQHAAGREAHRVLEDAREEIARLLGAHLTDRTPDKLIFTSGGTEANNLALLGSIATPPLSPARQGDENKLGRIIISSIEHPSVAATADYLTTRGWQVDRVSVNSDGVIRLEHLDELLSANSPLGLPQLVSVMLANNETGVIQPLTEIVRRCQVVGVPVHTDAVQAVGKLSIDFRALGVAAMTVAPHKFGGPRGIGALLVRHGVQISPVLHGATQQAGLRPGTESIALPLGFLAALKTWTEHRDEFARRMTMLRDRLESGLCNSLSPGERAGVRVPAKPQATINGFNAPRLPHTSNIAFLGHNRQALFMALDLAGVCCSTGSACASGSSEPSPTLVAMNLPREIIDSSLRFSLGPCTTVDEVDEALRRIAAAVGGR